MPQCQYYRVERGEIPNPERGSLSKRPPILIYREWCTHKHSPVSERDARIKSGKELKCEGDLKKCHIPPDQFLDTY